MEEGGREGVPRVEVGDVGVEAGEGVAVREEAGVGEGPAEDFGSLGVVSWVVKTEEGGGGILGKKKGKK